MEIVGLDKLDNPVWYALNEAHQQFAEGTGTFKRYESEIAPFAACDDSGNLNPSDWSQVLRPGDFCFFINKLPILPGGIIIENRIRCPQMVFKNLVKLDVPFIPIRLLDESDDDQILRLIGEVYPGYYKKGTRLLGDYYGIFDNDQLVAIAGERIRMYGLTEISAVVTHPAYGGRKYAQRLVMHLVEKNLQAGNTPFLHTEDTNQRAIRLYQHMGFVTRKFVDVWKVKHNSVQHV